MEIVKRDGILYYLKNENEGYLTTVNNKEICYYNRFNTTVVYNNNVTVIVINETINDIEYLDVYIVKGGDVIFKKFL